MKKIHRPGLRAKLFLRFMQFGLFTFGGGWSILNQMQKVYVEDEKLLTNEELLDLTSVGRSVPGAMICNVAMLFGYRIAGISGGLACVLGMSIPPFAILCGVTLLYDRLLNNLWAAAAIHGIRAAVAAIIVGAVIKMEKGAYKYPPCVAVTLFCFVLYQFFHAGCVVLILVGAVCGLVICEYYEKRDARQ